MAGLPPPALDVGDEDGGAPAADGADAYDDEATAAAAFHADTATAAAAGGVGYDHEAYRAGHGCRSEVRTRQLRARSRTTCGSTSHLAAGAAPRRAAERGAPEDAPGGGGARADAGAAAVCAHAVGGGQADGPAGARRVREDAGAARRGPQRRPTAR